MPNCWRGKWKTAYERTEISFIAVSDYALFKLDPRKFQEGFGIFSRAVTRYLWFIIEYKPNGDEQQLASKEHPLLRAILLRVIKQLIAGRWVRSCQDLKKAAVDVISLKSGRALPLNLTSSSIQLPSINCYRVLFSSTWA